jgi:hypothetical protein
VRGSNVEQPAVELAPATTESVVIDERRCHPRGQFVASVEMSDLKTGAISHARTADLSLSGCYIDTLNPLPLGSLVDVTIHKRNESLSVQGSVCMQCPGSGMGVAFDTLNAKQTAIVRIWLDQIVADSN